MVQNKYQIFLDSSFPIQLGVVFSLLPILQMVLVPVDKHAEFVESDVIIWKNSFLWQRQENITKS
jgi:hypothetical protein